MAKSFLVTAAMALGLIFPAGAEAKQTWTCNIFPGPKHFVNKDIKPWGKEVGEVTKGEIAVKFLPTSAAPPPKQVDGVAAGTFDCAFVFNAFTAKRAVGPLFGILPFLNAGNGEQGSVAYQRTWSKHFAAKNEFADDGIVVLSMFQFPGVHFFTARDTPINSIADLKNQKVWALAGTSSKTMKAAGVSHVSGPAARMAEFTQTKVVQGLAGITRAGIIQFAGITFPKSGTITSKSIMAPSFAWFVSKKKWEGVSPASQKAIMAISGEKLARAIGKTADEFEVIAAKRLKKAGVIEVKADAAFEADLVAAAKPQVDAWIKRAKTIGVDGAAVIADYKKLVSDLGS